MQPIVVSARENVLNNRCSWCVKDPLYIAYHDEEWGVPVYDDQKMFEFLILEGMQAGLSWFTILKKRESFRLAFDQFDPEKIARYSEHKINKLMNNPGIVRNQLKILGAVKNARGYLKIMEEKNSFSEYLWQFTDGKTLHHQREKLTDVPAHSKESDLMAKELKKRGFSFVGTTICYAHMQATGMVNDHLIDCFRHSELMV